MIVKLSYIFASLAALAKAASSSDDRPAWLQASQYTVSDGGKTWDDVLYSLKSMPQAWVNGTSDRLSRSSWTFSVGCAAAGAVQNPSYTDIYTAANTWFAKSNTGPTCSENEVDAPLAGITCASSTSAGTACTYQAAYTVWNAGIMDCYAYVLLESHVQSTCVDSGSGDCGCGVYYNYGTGMCLVASYAYHVSGPGTDNSEGITAEPHVPDTTVYVPETTDNNPSRRDTTGPSYNDLAVCAYSNDGDVHGWCEGAGTHVC